MVTVAPGAVQNTLAAGKGKSLTKLAYLPHCTGDVAAPTPLAPFALDPAKVDDKALQPTFKKYLDRLQEQVDKGTTDFGIRLADVPIALVDLTADPKRPRLAGFNLTASRHSASTIKLAVLYAAHQLRFDLLALAKSSGARSQQELFKLARALWAATQTPKRGATLEPLGTGARKLYLKDKLVYLDKATLSPRGFPAPNLEKIFAPTGATFAEFSSKGHGFPDLYQFEYPRQFPEYEGKLERLSDAGFEDRLRLMVGQSHNGATGSCVHDVGFLFIASALMQAGLYDPDVGGLWMGDSYGGVGFVNDPVNGRNLSATAIAHASLMTLFARDELVSREASLAMRPLLRKSYFDAADFTTHTMRRYDKKKREWVEYDEERVHDAPKYMTRDAGLGTRSPFLPALEAFPSDPPMEVHSKLGLLGGALGVSDVAWITRTPPAIDTPKGKVAQPRNSFVLVGLGASDAVLKLIANAATKAVQEVNRRTA